VITELQSGISTSIEILYIRALKLSPLVLNGKQDRSSSADLKKTIKENQDIKIYFQWLNMSTWIKEK
jgi:hypothetical protein